MNYRPLYSIAVALLMIVGLAGCKREGGSGSEPTPPTPPQMPTIKIPRGELRAVWMTTAWELDWPRSNYNPQVQRELYVERLDLLHKHHFNAVFFQVRPMGDAFYDSKYEPWSKFITGKRGQDPGYDVLGFMIKEAHERGMEFHAWINPYRIETRPNNKKAFGPLHPSIPREWVWDLEKIRMYNPALPEVRQRLLDIIDELLTKYPGIDGIHFDDYFYPEQSQGAFDDAADYKKYGSEYSTITDFRIDNVNKMVSSVSQMLRTKHPGVTFSISPGSNADHNLKDLYADTRHWCKNGWLDLIIPQLYQATNPTSQSGFYQRLSWFCQFSYKTPLAVGHAAYRVGEEGFSTNADEISKQIAIARKDPRVYGGIYYRLQDLVDNRGGILDRLSKEYPTVMPLPCFSRTTKAVSPVRDLSYKDGRLTWVTTGKTRSVIYFTSSVDQEAVVLDITEGSSLEVSRKGYYCVTALNEDNLQSKISEVLELK